MNKKEKLIWYRKEFDNISNDIGSKQELSYLDFLRIRNFKLQNSSRESVDNVSKITNEAFELAKKDKIEEAISQLLNLHGVAVPIASTILAMRFPNKFCIIDRIVINNIGKKEWLKGYLTDPKIYREYLTLMRQKAKDRGTELREYERTLFEKGIN